MAQTDKRFREVPIRPPAAADPKKPKEPADAIPKAPAAQKGESGGPTGPEPTRYGDWERGGRCTDF